MLFKKGMLIFLFLIPLAIANSIPIVEVNNVFNKSRGEITNFTTQQICLAGNCQTTWGSSSSSGGGMDYTNIVMRNISSNNITSIDSVMTFNGNNSILASATNPSGGIRFVQTRPEAKDGIWWRAYDQATDSVTEVGWIVCHFNSTNGNTHSHCAWETLDNSTGTPSINSHFTIDYNGSQNLTRVQFPSAWVSQMRVDDIFSLLNDNIDFKADTAIRAYPSKQTTIGLSISNDTDNITITGLGTNNIEFLDNGYFNSKNVSASYFKGNGSLLTDLPSGYAKYQFDINNFNGSGNFTTIGYIWSMYQNGTNISIGGNRARTTLEVNGSAVIDQFLGLGSQMPQFPLDVNGVAYIRSNIYADIFVDRGATSYYIHPFGFSNLYDLNISNQLTVNIFAPTSVMTSLIYTGDTLGELKLKGGGATGNTQGGVISLYGSGHTTRGQDITLGAQDTAYHPYINLSNVANRASIFLPTNIEGPTDINGTTTIKNGVEKITHSTQDYTNSYGDNLFILMNNTDSNGQTGFGMIVDGNYVMKARTDWLGDFMWSSYVDVNSPTSAGHYFCVNGDYPNCIAKMKISYVGITIDNNAVGDSPDHILRVGPAFGEYLYTDEVTNKVNFPTGIDSGSYSTSGGANIGGSDTYTDGVDSSITWVNGLVISKATNFDTKLMQNVTKLNPTSMIANLTPISFNWNNDGQAQFTTQSQKSQVNYGFNSSEVLKYYPQCALVRQENDTFIINITTKEINIKEAYETYEQNLTEMRNVTIYVPNLEKNTVDEVTQQRIVVTDKTETKTRLKKDVTFNEHTGVFTQTSRTPLLQKKGGTFTTYNKDCLNVMLWSAINKLCTRNPALCQ